MDVTPSVDPKSLREVAQQIRQPDRQKATLFVVGLRLTLDVFMNGRVAILLLVFVATIAVVKADGVNGKAFFIFSFVSAMIGISWFFSSRRAKAPSAFEIVVANIWLVFRRIVCCVGALFFVFAAVMVGFSLFQRAAEQSLMERLGVALCMLAMAAFCVWVAIFGQGERRFDWRDDVELHRENKRRYHWRR